MTLLPIEIGASFILDRLAETIGGSQEFGPGVLKQQWALGKAVNQV
jgi:hypothetical protein